jgi:hypothetical protein
MKKRQHPEDDLQKAVWEWYLWQQPGCIMFAVPNGGVRNPREMARFKTMGLVPGVADLILLWGEGGGAIELKVGKGKQSIAQKEFESCCESFEIPYRVCHSVDEVKAACQEWGLL